MSDLFGIGSAIGGIGGSLINGIFQKKINDKNIEFQEDANAQNIALTREAWARDDNAVQRRVDDLIKAGLSPTLAAGSSAGNSSPTQVQAPQIDHNPIGSAIEFASALGTVMQQFASVEKTKAETIRTLTNNNYLDDYNAFRNAFIRSRWETQEWKTENEGLKANILANSMDSQVDRINWESKLRKAQYEYLNKQLDIFNQTNIDPTANYGIGNILKLLLGDLSDFSKGK